MHVVAVEFEVLSERVASFRDAILRQAASSMELERGCRQFDVCFDRGDERLCFLYERYDDRAAFEEHLASDHFQEFDATVADWVASKTVRIWELAAPNPGGPA